VDIQWTYTRFVYIINIIIIIIIIIIISFMQSIYTHIPETHYAPREYSVAATLLLLFMVLISLVSALNLLYFYISTFRILCAVPNMAVFCSSLTSWFPGMLLTYFLNDFEIVPVAPIITGITFVFTFHTRFISIVRFFILKSSRIF
jgi:magnesium-transporting ATPase (P-type)